jgi:hypothetical protein
MTVTMCTSQPSVVEDSQASSGYEITRIRGDFDLLGEVFH